MPHAIVELPGTLTRQGDVTRGDQAARAFVTSISVGVHGATGSCPTGSSRSVPGMAGGPAALPAPRAEPHDGSAVFDNADHSPPRDPCSRYRRTQLGAVGGAGRARVAVGDGFGQRERDRSTDTVRRPCCPGWMNPVSPPMIGALAGTGDSTAWSRTSLRRSFSAYNRNPFRRCWNPSGLGCPAYSASCQPFLRSTGPSLSSTGEQPASTGPAAPHAAGFPAAWRGVPSLGSVGRLVSPRGTGLRGVLGAAARCAAVWHFGCQGPGR